MSKAKDFSESAVKLCNPVEVKDLLEKLSAEQATLSSLNEELKASNAPLLEKVTTSSKAIADLTDQIKSAIKEFGSYQDTENERYGVQYARSHKVYHIEPFIGKFPKFVELCVKQTIDVTALEGQIKGKLLTEEALATAGVITYDKDFAFYVR